MVLSISLLVYI